MIPALGQKPSGRTRHRRVPFSRAVALLEIAAADTREFAWLDGGTQGRSFVGIEADQVIESDRIRTLEAVDRAWRAAPDHLWIGWLTYELGVDALLGRRPSSGRFPGLCFRRYPAALEHARGRMRWHGKPRAVAKLRDRLEASGHDALDRSWPWEQLAPTLAPSLYRQQVASVLRSIAAGDTYQVNLSQVFQAAWQTPPLGRRARARAVAGAYGRLRRATPASMGALIAAGDAWILSNSPETLIDVRRSADGHGDRARTWPIKGTRSRRSDPVQDRRATAELLQDAKERAEHLMIVDLMRNDLGQIAQPGSVSAPAEPSLMSLPTVHHLVSEVSCRLRSGWSLRSLIEAVFPGGSITGAPKRRTVEIIESLEMHRRGIYCGAIVVLEPGGLTASIPIRTAIADRNGLTICSGGGIVADSDPEAERLETLIKARAFDSGG